MYVRTAVKRLCGAALIGGVFVTVPLANALAAPQIGVTAALRGEVVRTASLQTGAAIGQMSSGQNVFLGDDIKVGSQGRLQVMLLDETIFTLGANSVMRIDEFVYDPADAANAKLSTSITQGAFRFVSGQIAKTDQDAMKVKLPGATIGVRGTSVAGDVAPDGSASVILLGPAPNNSLGLPAGAINVANQAGSVDITRPGFATQIAVDLPPQPPAQASQAQIQSLERALSEEASDELAEGLGVEPTQITAERGTDADGDGQLDSFVANEALSNAILEAAGSEGGVVNAQTGGDLLEAVAETLFGADNLAALSDEERSDFFRGINLGEDIGNLLAGDFEYLGPTSFADLANSGLTGSITFSGSQAIIQDEDGRDSGIFDLVQKWDFANSRISSTISGNFSILDTADGNNTVYRGTFDGDQTQIIPYSQAASGNAGVSFTTSFSPLNSNATLSNSYADLGGQVYAGGVDDGSGNLIVSTIDTDVTPSNMGSEIPVVGLSSYATLDADSISALQATYSGGGDTSFRRIDIYVNSELSNVNRKDGTNPIGSFGQGSVNIILSDNSDNQNDINQADGTIFAMKRTIEEE